MRPAVSSPETEEAKQIGFLVALLGVSQSELFKGSGFAQLLYAGVNWQNLYQSAYPPGALPPSMARETMTRAAHRRWANDRKERRGALSLLRAVRAA